MCERELPDGAGFCGYCGSALIKKENKCMKCGNLIPDGMAFCMFCGTPANNSTKIVNSTNSVNTEETSEKIIIKGSCSRIMGGAVSGVTGNIMLTNQKLVFTKMNRVMTPFVNLASDADAFSIPVDEIIGVEEREKSLSLNDYIVITTRRGAKYTLLFQWNYNVWLLYFRNIIQNPEAWKRQ